MGNDGLLDVCRYEGRELIERKSFREVDYLWGREEGVGVGRDGFVVEFWERLDYWVEF